MSKWYYSFTVTKEHSRLFIAVHQEDERINGVLLRRPYLDVGIVLLRRTKDDVELVDLKDFATYREVELEVILEPGSYIVLPRTTGCSLKRLDD